MATFNNQSKTTTNYWDLVNTATTLEVSEANSISTKAATVLSYISADILS